VGDYLPADAGTYDLEARIAGADTATLSVPGVMPEEGTVLAILAMGLAGGEPALTSVPGADANQGAATPETLPVARGETTSLWLLGALGAETPPVTGWLGLNRHEAKVTVRKPSVLSLSQGGPAPWQNHTILLGREMGGLFILSLTFRRARV
jgi:hypothetical protein